MTNTFRKLSDFVIKVIIMFTTLVALVFFAGYYPLWSMTFSIIALALIFAIIVKGLFDIFSKD